MSASLRVKHAGHCTICNNRILVAYVPTLMLFVIYIEKGVYLWDAMDLKVLLITVAVHINLVCCSICSGLTFGKASWARKTMQSNVTSMQSNVTKGHYIFNPLSDSTWAPTAKYMRVDNKISVTTRKCHVLCRAWVMPHDTQSFHSTIYEPL